MRKALSWSEVPLGPDAVLPSPAGSTDASALFVLLALVTSACGERTPPAPSVEDVARAHAAPGLELAGLWREEGQNRVLWILPDGDGFDVRAVAMPGVHQERVRGVLSGAVLELDPPLAGSAELHLCRFGTREVLLDPRGTRIGVQTGQPHGAVFERWKPELARQEAFASTWQEEAARAGASVDEPMPAGLWQLVEPAAEWAWLEVTPTGLPAAFRGRLRRRADGELMPANTFVRASFDSRALTFEPPILGEARWRLHLSGEQAWLVPETAPSTEARANPAEVPTGTHFRLVSRASSPAGPPPTWGIDVLGEE